MTLWNSRIHRGMIISGETIGVSQQILTELKIGGCSGRDGTRESGVSLELHFSLRTSAPKNELSVPSPL